MMVKIVISNGAEHHFPDEATEQDILAAMMGSQGNSDPFKQKINEGFGLPSVGRLGLSALSGASKPGEFIAGLLTGGRAPKVSDYVMPDNPTLPESLARMGAETLLGGKLLKEIGGPILKGAASQAYKKVAEPLAEFANPERKAAEVAKKIQEAHSSAKQFGTENFYGPSVNKHGKALVESEYVSNLFKQDPYKTGIPEEVKEARNTFERSPNIENMHHLKKTLGDWARKYENRYPNKAFKLNSLKDALNEKLIENLNNIEPGAGELYQSGDVHHLKEVVPFEKLDIPSTELDWSKKISPQKLLGKLEKVAAEDPESIQGHYLSQALQELAPPVYRGRFFSVGYPEKASGIIQNPWAQRITKDALGIKGK